jgi:hypothetical protein
VATGKKTEFFDTREYGFNKRSLHGVIFDRLMPNSNMTRPDVLPLRALYTGYK